MELSAYGCIELVVMGKTPLMKIRNNVGDKTQPYSAFFCPFACYHFSFGKLTLHFYALKINEANCYNYINSVGVLRLTSFESKRLSSFNNLSTK